MPEIAFDSAADPLKFPANIHPGEIAGVATNSKGDVFVYTRTGRRFFNDVDLECRFLGRIRDAMTKIAREFGRQGGKKAARNSTPEERSARAKKASMAAAPRCRRHKLAPAVQAALRHRLLSTEFRWAAVNC